jgi:hypothetical protein
MRQTAKIPARTRAKHPQHPVYKDAIVLCGAPAIALFTWQQFGDPRPLRIRQFIPLGHPCLPYHIDPESKESST